MRPVATLVLLASEGEARLTENRKKGEGLIQIGFLSADDFADVDQGFTEAPGRMSAAPGMGGHAFTPRESERDARRTAFAGHILEALTKAWDKGNHDRLIIAAPPRLLGELRDRISRPIAAALTADLPKDLVKVPLKDLPAHFNDIAAF